MTIIQVEHGPIGREFIANLAPIVLVGSGIHWRLGGCSSRGRKGPARGSVLQGSGQGRSGCHLEEVAAIHGFLLGGIVSALVTDHLQRGSMITNSERFKSNKIMRLCESS